jgi:hypothetical protein
MATWVKYPFYPYPTINPYYTYITYPDKRQQQRFADLAGIRAKMSPMSSSGSWGEDDSSAASLHGGSMVAAAASAVAEEE